MMPGFGDERFGTEAAARLEGLRPYGAEIARVALAAAATLVFAGEAMRVSPTKAQETNRSSHQADAIAADATKAEAATATKTVRVVDVDGKPVAGATVVPWAIRSRAGHGPWTPAGQGGSEPPTLTTDTDGVAHVPIPKFAVADEKLPPDALTCRIAHPDFAESVYNDAPVAGVLRDEVMTITLRRGATIEVLATENGNRLGAKNVYALASSPSKILGQPLSLGTEGALQISRLPAGNELLRIVHLREDGPPSFSDVQRLELEDGESLRIEVELQPGVDVAGRLADGVPRPVINGRVVADLIDLGAGDARESLSWRTWARINPDGTFLLKGLPTGELQVIALCDGYMAASGEPPAFVPENERKMRSSFSRPQVFTVSDKGAHVVLAMTPTAEASIRALDTEGQPVAGAEVHFWPNVGWWGGGSQVYVHPLYHTAEILKQGKVDWSALDEDQPFSATTGEDGIAVIPNLPPGREQFTVLHEKLEMAAGDNPGLRSEAINLLGGERREATVILHAKGTQPLVEVGNAPGNDAGGRIMTLIPKPRPPRVVETQAAETELAGVVLDEEGHPLEGVKVDAWTWHPGNETQTDAEGRFSLKGFDAGEGVEVEFTKSDYSPSLFIGQKAGTDNWTVVLTKGTWLEGTVTDSNGKPVPAAEVRAFRGPFRNPGVVISEVWMTTKSRKDGTYRLNVEAGTYDVQVRQPGVGVVRQQAVKVAHKEKQQLDLRLERGITLRAFVRNSETGAPVEGIVLWNWRQPGIEATSDPRGVLEITDLADGESDFNVSAAGVDRRRSSVAGDYARWWSPQAANKHQRLEENGGFRRNFDDLTFQLNGQLVEVEVFVEPAVTVTGRVLDPDGKPVAGATVAPAKTGSGNSLTGDTRFSYETDENGRFEMKIPASGEAEYNLIAHDGKYGEWRKWANGFGQPFRTEPGQKFENVELTLTRPATILGRVTNSRGELRRNVEVRAVSIEKHDNRYYVPTTRTDDDGHYKLKFVAPGRHHVQVAPFWLNADEAPGSTTHVVEIEAGETVEGVDFTAD